MDVSWLSVYSSCFKLVLVKSYSEVAIKTCYVLKKISVTHGTHLKIWLQIFLAINHLWVSQFLFKVDCSSLNRVYKWVWGHGIMNYVLFDVNHALWEFTTRNLAPDAATIWHTWFRTDSIHCLQLSSLSKRQVMLPFMWVSFLILVKPHWGQLWKPTTYDQCELCFSQFSYSCMHGRGQYL